jgi:methionine-rich copper-binding protein CopC
MSRPDKDLLVNRTIRTLAVTGAITALAAPAAFAHAEVTKLSPKSGSAVARSLSAVSIGFSEAVVGGKLVVKSASGTKVSSGSKLVNHKRGLRATLKTLHKGRYTAKATWIADDGDKQSKTWSFKVK